MRAVVSLRGREAGVIEVSETMLRRLDRARREAGTMRLRLMPSPRKPIAMPPDPSGPSVALSPIDINVWVRSFATDFGLFYVVEVSPIEDGHVHMFKPPWLPDARPDCQRRIGDHVRLMTALQDALHTAAAKLPKARGEALVV